VLRERLGQPDHHRDRAQREADAAGARRLLAEHAEPERHVLVHHAALEPADPDRAEHVVGALHRVHQVRGGAKRQPLAALGRQALQHLADPLQPGGVDVVQHDLGEAEPLGSLQQRAVDERDAEAAAADDRQLHATVTSMPRVMLARLLSASRDVQKRRWTFGHVAFGSPMPEPGVVRKQLPKRKRPFQEAGRRTLTEDM
jgi:hypothetical protein